MASRSRSSSPRRSGSTGCGSGGCRSRAPREREGEGDRPEVPSPAPVLPADRDVRSVKDTKQTYIGRAYALPSPATPADHAKGVLLEVLVGQGPGSRLWDLRTAGRLAYNVDSRVTWTRGGGILEAFLETESSKAARAAEALDGTLREHWEKGVGSGEVEATKTMAKAGFLRSAEMKVTRIRILGGFEVLGLGFEHIAGLFEAIDAVTLEDLNAYVRSVLDPEKALRIDVGPEGPGPSKG